MEFTKEQIIDAATRVGASSNQRERFLEELGFEIERMPSTTTYKVTVSGIHTEQFSRDPYVYESNIAGALDKGLKLQFTERPFFEDGTVNINVEREGDD